MCRDDDHGGRRCPHDTSEARQARRVRAREGAKLTERLSNPAETAGTKVLADSRDSYRETIEALGLQHFDEDSPRDAQSALGRRREHPATLEHSVALTNAVSALYNYRQAQRQLGTIENKLWYTALNEREIEAEKAMLLLGDRVFELAKHHGTPEQAEWDAVTADWNAAHSSAKDVMAQLDNELAVLRRSMKHAIRIDDIVGYNEKRAVFNEKVRDYNATLTASTAAASAAGNAAYNDLIQRRGAAYRAALQEMGVEFAEPDSLVYQMDKNRPKLARVLGQAINHYPRMWVARARAADSRRGTLQVGASSRAGYNQGDNRLGASKADIRETVHELGHYLEHSNTYIPEAERYFINRRSGILAAHQAGQRTIPRRMAADSRGNGEGYPDNFTTAYVGRIYEYKQRQFAHIPHGAFEVLTTGMETIFVGSYGGGRGMGGYKADPEQEKFVLGLLASAADI